MMGNLENSSDEFVGVSPRVDNVLIHNTGKLSRSNSAPKQPALNAVKAKNWERLKIPDS